MSQKPWNTSWRKTEFSAHLMIHKVFLYARLHPARPGDTLRVGANPSQFYCPTVSAADCLLPVSAVQLREGLTQGEETWQQSSAEEQRSRRAEGNVCTLRETHRCRLQQAKEDQNGRQYKSEEEQQKIQFKESRQQRNVSQITHLLNADFTVRYRKPVGTWLEFIDLDLITVKQHQFGFRNTETNLSFLCL